ncbi:hypothetical protein [Kitasatospora sp. NPDC059571]|uniref:hypothetical protein n=1 Tax=Kitasatospora sp. NPDC059571 TaxID=3346871 RepID=UPI0036A4D0FA
MEVQVRDYGLSAILSPAPPPVAVRALGCTDSTTWQAGRTHLEPGIPPEITSADDSPLGAALTCGRRA